MTIDRNLADELWKDIYGDDVWVTDCFGTWMHKDDYGDIEKVRTRPNGDGKNYNYGWNIDHIMPQDNGGKDHLNNFELMHHSNNNAKDSNISFKINDIPYQVVKCDLCPGYGYGIKNQKSNKRVDWKAIQNRCYDIP